MDQKIVTRSNNRRTLALFLFSLANYAFMYVANILLARSLTVSQFDDYSVAVSLVTIVSTATTLGLEKYALYVIAIFHDRESYARMRGFLEFSLKTILLVSSGVTLFLISGIESILSYRHADLHFAIVVYLCFLPTISIALFLVEVVTAYGAQILSMAIYRLLLPCLYLALILVLHFVPERLSASAALFCFGFSWTVALSALFYWTMRLTPAEVAAKASVTAPRKWLSISIPLVINSLMMMVMTSGGVTILEVLYPSGVEVSLYAVAAQTSSFITLIATSTNRYYLPIMMVLMERRNKKELLRLMRQRSIFIGSLIVFFVTALVFFGDAILKLFGDHFAAGYKTLLVIAVGAAFSTIFADVPYYLQFMRLHRTVLKMTVTAGSCMVFLSFLFGRSYGHLGVAVAYMSSVTLLFIGLKLIAMKTLNNL